MGKAPKARAQKTSPQGTQRKGEQWKMADKNVVDARGRSCPEPVIMTKQALDQNGNRATVLVDNQVAVDNITRFAENRGLKVLVKEKDGDFELTIG